MEDVVSFVPGFPKHNWNVTAEAPSPAWQCGRCKVFVSGQLPSIRNDICGLPLIAQSWEVGDVRGWCCKLDFKERRFTLETRTYAEWEKNTADYSHQGTFPFGAGRPTTN